MSLESLRMTGAAETPETAAATAGTALPQGAVSEEEARQFRAIMERGGTPGESAGGAPEEGAEQPRAGGRQAAEPQQRAATGGSVSKDGVQDFNAVQDRSAAAAGQPESARPAAVRHDEAERFRSALERRSELPRHDAESGTARAGRRDGSAAGADPASIASLFSQGTLAEFSRGLAAAGAAPAEAAPPAALSGAEIESLVDRILVSTPADGGSEVRISLGDKALPDTEIILARDRFGELKVSLVTTNPSSFQTLVGARSDLQGRLETRENGPVRVEVSDLRNGDNADGGEGDTRRRSRGLDAYGQYQEG